MRVLLAMAGLALPLAAQVNVAALPLPADATGESALSIEIAHVLAELPYYGVFDNLEYTASPGAHGAMVRLSGAVTRPTLKRDAGIVVRHIDGVEQVENRIRVLPLSPEDDRIRLAEYRAVYGYPALQRYALAAIPPIHIVVANGRVILVGSVVAKADKALAGARAKNVPGVLGVGNQLLVVSNQ